MIVKGYNTLFTRAQHDVSDSVRLVLSRMTPLFTITMKTLQPREQMKINTKGSSPHVNYITIEYDSETEPQPLKQTWYYFAEFDPASPATPNNVPYNLYVDWWAMSVDWYGEDPVGLNIKHGYITRSHWTIDHLGTEQVKGTGLAVRAENPRKRAYLQKPTARYPSYAAVVALYHVNGSIFSLPGTDKYLQVIVPVMGEDGTPTTQDDVVNAIYFLSNGKTVKYTVNYTDESGAAQTFTEEPDISECVGLWVIPHWIFDDMYQNARDSIASATVRCHTMGATSVVVPVGLAKDKDFPGWAVTGDYAAIKTMDISGDVRHYRYFGNPGANIVIPQTLEDLKGQILVRFSLAQQSFSVKFAANGSITDATNSFSVNVSTENSQIEARNAIIKGGISAITAAVGAAVAGPAGAGVGLLATGSGIANAAAAGVGLANYSRYSEGMNGIENMVCLDYLNGTTAYIYGCALVGYEPDNMPQVMDEYNDHGITCALDRDWIDRDTTKKYRYYEVEDCKLGASAGICEPARQEMERLLREGVRIWNDTSQTNFLTVKTWQ